MRGGGKTREDARRREKTREVISPLRRGRLCVSARESNCPGLARLKNFGASGNRVGELRWRRRSGSGFLTEARRHGGRTRTRRLRAMRGRGKTREDARSHPSSSPRPPPCLCASVRDLETVSRTPPGEGRRFHRPHESLKTRKNEPPPDPRGTRGRGVRLRSSKRITSWCRRPTAGPSPERSGGARCRSRG
jgi:hypothetical protein